MTTTVSADRSVRTAPPRLEYKYLLSPRQALLVKNALLSICRRDPHSRSEAYRVVSTYFDTPHLTEYVSKLEGLGTRSKWRIRTYPSSPDSPVLLEAKRKRGTLYFKESYPLAPRLVDSLSEGRFPETAPEWFQSFLTLLRTSPLVPTVVISYRREAFFLRDDPACRFSFDRKIAAQYTRRLFEESVHPRRPLHPGHIVFECKLKRSRADLAHRLVKEFALPAIAHSKYFYGVTATNPYLL
ncbi:MAG: polyphosphate polymerase domain-containing protein [Candidatus Hydrogenedentota bacterium]|nr:MAG: polyphosphate polymerase domain-containing protein [Candidatus Hydrogenedentota bacterium]